MDRPKASDHCPIYFDLQLFVPLTHPFSYPFPRPMARPYVDYRPWNVAVPAPPVWHSAASSPALVPLNGPPAHSETGTGGGKAGSRTPSGSPYMTGAQSGVNVGALKFDLNPSHPGYASTAANGNGGGSDAGSNAGSQPGSATFRAATWADLNRFAAAEDRASNDGLGYVTL